jgi:hypothetical protein
VARRMRIAAGMVSTTATLNDSPSADALWAALPVTGAANTWGDEIYFAIPVEDDLADDARADMAVGEIAYWPPGSAFCLFFGPTPASTSDAPRAASPVNPLGQVDGDATVFRAVRDGEKVVLSRA